MTDLKSLISQVNDEIKREKEAAMSPADRKLSDVARRLLHLERDLSVPGAASSDGTRRERVLRFIEEEDF
jgi:hypothetical protein